MTTEEKELVIRDICARLPYKVKIHIGKTQRIEIFDDINLRIGSINNTYADIRPYLYPISSINEEQKKELYKLGWYVERDKIYSTFRNYDEVNYKTHTDSLELVNWCYKNHIDINGLIPMGLAIDATNLKE